MKSFHAFLLMNLALLPRTESFPATMQSPISTTDKIEYTYSGIDWTIVNRFRLDLVNTHSSEF